MENNPSLVLVEQLASTSNALRKRLIQKFRSHGLDITPEQYGVLTLISEHEKMNQDAIAKGVGRDKTTLSRVIKSMEQNKLVTRSKDKKDGRGLVVELTSNGSEALEQLKRISFETKSGATKGVFDAHLNIALEVLRTIDKNLNL